MSPFEECQPLDLGTMVNPGRIYSQGVFWNSKPLVFGQESWEAKIFQMGLYPKTPLVFWSC